MNGEIKKKNEEQLYIKVWVTFQIVSRLVKNFSQQEMPSRSAFIEYLTWHQMITEEKHGIKIILYFIYFFRRINFVEKQGGGGQKNPKASVSRKHLLLVWLLNKILVYFEKSFKELRQREKLQLMEHNRFCFAPFAFSIFSVA